MRFLLIAALSALSTVSQAQNRPLVSADSALVGRILLAEDRRDSTDPALVEGAAHADPRVSILARRALGRIRTPRFVSRDSFPALPAPPVWPEPAWRLRFRALTPQVTDCHAFQVALADSAWPVRLHAADLVPPACAADDSIVATLRAWIDALPRDVSRREPGGVSWHAAAHAAVALARLSPEAARAYLPALASHRDWHVRLYAARAAAVLSDTLRLQALLRDRDDNVKEAAIDGLSRLTGHADDSLFVAALDADGAQAVRAAAVALKGSPRPGVTTAAAVTFAKWVAKGVASARDVRIALLEVTGSSPGDDRPPPPRYTLPPDAVALALGKDVRLRVTMSPASGGGSFMVRLRGDVAPMMAARILQLARSGYYDHGNWHRVEADFVIQGAGPGTNEYVGYSQYLRDELGTVPHVRGTVGMSTRGHDSGDAQWFINLRDNPRLGRDYTVFGEVVEGIDVVDGILEGDVIASIRPVPPGT